VNAASPPARRGQVASNFFLVAYVAISLPVVGVGVLADMIGRRAAGLIFAAVVAALAGTALVLVTRATPRPRDRSARQSPR
jgi:MFS family permease